MARSGIFNLVARDGRFEDLTQSLKLEERLASVRRRRAANGERVAAPTFADVAATHLLHVRESYRPHVALSSEYVKVMAEGGRSSVTLDGARGADRRIEFPLPSYGHFTSDIAFHVKLPSVGSAGGSTYYRWAALPGVRLLKTVRFMSDRTVVDEYDADDAALRAKFRLEADRRPAWERSVGQEETRTATYFNRNGWTGEVAYRDGLQTPKKLQPAADLWVPADFWMCESVAAALPTSLMPTTQRRVVVDLEALSRMVYAEDGCGNSRSLTLSGVKVEVAMYVNCLFTNPEVAAIFHERVGFSLIRVHRAHTARILDNTGSLLLNNLKWPVEYLLAGARAEGNASSPDQWHLMGRPRSRARAEYITVPVLYYNGSNDQLVARDASETSALDPVVNTLGLQAESDVMIYPVLPASFFGAYLPGRYFDEARVSASTDPHAYLLNFCLWPGRREQSGTLDTSAIRDLRLLYTASGVSREAPAEFIVRATAINFLVRKGDRVHLRYGL